MKGKGKSKGEGKGRGKSKGKGKGNVKGKEVAQPVEQKPQPPMESIDELLQEQKPQPVEQEEEPAAPKKKSACKYNDNTIRSVVNIEYDLHQPYPPTSTMPLICCKYRL